MIKTKAPVVWFEILVSNLERASTFYNALFGWEFEPFIEYDQNYWIIQGNKNSIGGALVLNPFEKCENHGIVIFMEVNSIEDSIECVKSLAGIIEQAPKLISKLAGTFALIQDLDGNLIGLWHK